MDDPKVTPGERPEGAVVQPTSSMQTVRSLHDLVSIVDHRTDLYVRWSSGPDCEGVGGSRDALTGVRLPGLSANPVGVEPWWGDRPLEVWIARRIYDYRHLQDRDGARAPWLLTGRECGRGPDNEPLVVDVTPIAWIDGSVVQEARTLIDNLNENWGPLERDSED